MELGGIYLPLAGWFEQLHLPEVVKLKRKSHCFLSYPLFFLSLFHIRKQQLTSPCGEDVPSHHWAISKSTIWNTFLIYERRKPGSTPLRQSRRQTTTRAKRHVGKAASQWAQMFVFEGKSCTTAAHSGVQYLTLRLRFNTNMNGGLQKTWRDLMLYTKKYLLSWCVRGLLDSRGFLFYRPWWEAARDSAPCLLWGHISQHSSTDRYSKPRSLDPLKDISSRVYL